MEKDEVVKRFLAPPISFVYRNNMILLKKVMPADRSLCTKEILKVCDKLLNADRESKQMSEKVSTLHTYITLLILLAI
jgi:hypothetical protein